MDQTRHWVVCTEDTPEQALKIELALKPQLTEGWSELVAWTQADQLPGETKISAFSTGFKSDLDLNKI